MSLYLVIYMQTGIMAEINRTVAPLESRAVRAEKEGRYHEAADMRIRAGDALLAPLKRSDRRAELEKLGVRLSKEEGRIYGYPIIELARRAQRHFEDADADVAALIRAGSKPYCAAGASISLSRTAKRRIRTAQQIIKDEQALNDAFDQQP
jgi:hypothetical protein